MKSFGLSSSPEEALEKVEAAWKSGTGWPRRLSAIEFQREARGGTFYPVPIHLQFRVPEIKEPRP